MNSQRGEILFNTLLTLEKTKINDDTRVVSRVTNRMSWVIHELTFLIYTYFSTIIS